MKYSVVILSVFAVSAIADNTYIDWSKVVPRSNIKDGKIVDPTIRSFPDGQNGRIVGGQEVIPHSHPYIVALIVQTFAGDALCQGSIISMETVLTTAYCLVESFSAQVIVGAHDITRLEDSQQRRFASNLDYRIHPGFDDTVKSNKLYAFDILISFSLKILSQDVATIILTVPLVFDQYVQRIMLPSSFMINEDFANELGTVSGWGFTSAGSFFQTLHSVQSNTLSVEECRLFIGAQSTPNHICLNTMGEIKMTYWLYWLGWKII